MRRVRNLWMLDVISVEILISTYRFVFLQLKLNFKVKHHRKNEIFGTRQQKVHLSGGRKWIYCCFFPEMMPISALWRSSSLASTQHFTVLAESFSSFKQNLGEFQRKPRKLGNSETFMELARYWRGWLSQRPLSKITQQGGKSLKTREGGVEKS